MGFDLFHVATLSSQRPRKDDRVVILSGTTLYSTLQPCGMCNMASVWSKVDRVVYGARRDDVHPMYFEAKHVDTLGFIADVYRDDSAIEGGCLRDECAGLYYGPDVELPEEGQANL